MATFTGTGVSAVTAPTVNGNTTIVLTNTSSFIGTVFLETSLDAGLTWPTPSTPLIQGTMVAGPLTFVVNTPQLAIYQTAQHRLRCSAYTSGTLTYTMTEATVPAVVNGISPNNSGNLIGSFPGGLAGTATNDSGAAGMIGEIVSNTADFATAGITATMTTASPTVVTMTAHGQSAGAAVWFTNSGGGIGTGLVVSTNYYVTAGTVTANTFQMSSTMALALAGTADMNVTIAGTGTQTGHPGALLASATAADVVGINLTPGDWDVEAMCAPTYQGSTSQTLFAAWLGTAGASSLPATSGALIAAGAVQQQTAAIVQPANTYCTQPVRVSLSAAGIAVLSVKSTFSVSTTSVTGIIRARRVR